VKLRHKQRRAHKRGNFVSKGTGDTLTVAREGEITESGRRWVQKNYLEWERGSFQIEGEMEFFDKKRVRHPK